MSVQRFRRCALRPSSGISFFGRGVVVLRFFGLLSSSLFMSVQRFRRCALRPSSGISHFGGGDYDTSDYYPHIYLCLVMMVRVFAYGPGELGSIPARVIPKTLKMVLDVSLLNTQHYKVGIKGKVEKSRERSNALPYTLV